MLFSSRLSLANLIELCRAVRHYQGAGLSLVEVFHMQAQRGPGAVRPVAARVSRELEKGTSLADALEPEKAYFPPLLLSLAKVGEQTGNVPEVFHELEKYFQRQQALRRQFWAGAAWPIVQFVLATLVLALMLFVLGQLAPSGTKPFDPLGLGLSGASGAAIFLGVIWGTIFGLFALYALLTRVLRQRPAVDRFLLRLPAVGPCLHVLALGRFCLALRLTTESGMSVRKALRLALRATGNGAFAATSAEVGKAVEQGEDLTFALSRTRLIPHDFERILAVGEESGTLSEVLRHQAEHYHEEATRRLGLLTRAASFAVWGLVAVFIIVAIFRIYFTYLNLLNSI